MASGGLGRDTEEYFMGHKVSGDVEKLYKDLPRLARKNWRKRRGTCSSRWTGAYLANDGGMSIPRFSISALTNSRNCSLEAKPRLYSQFQWA